jgi:hypothetical protein
MVQIREKSQRDTEKKEKMMFKDGYTGVSTKGAGKVDLESGENLYPGLSSDGASSTRSTTVSLPPSSSSPPSSPSSSFRPPRPHNTPVHRENIIAPVHANFHDCFLELMKRDVRRVTSLDELRLLESERHVGVHAGVEVLDDCGVVEGLALLLRTTEIVVGAEMMIFSLGQEKHLVEYE